MSCSACSAAVTRAVEAVAGTKETTVSLLTGSMVVVYDEKTVSAEEICRAVDRAGYSASVGAPRTKDGGGDAEWKKKKTGLAVSAALCVVLMYFTMGHMIGLPVPPFADPHGTGWEPAVFAAIQFVLATPILIINRRYFIDGMRSAFRGSANMNTLIATGAGASYIYAVYITVRIFAAAAAGGAAHELTGQLYYESAAMIPVLISLGKTLEGRENRKTAGAISALLSMTPETAETEKDGETVTVSADLLERGDIVVLRAGGRVPCDGVMISGSGTVDESIVTGESAPIDKEAGDRLVAGSLFVSGFCRMEATETGEETTVAKIASLVEEAAASRAPVGKLADRISGVFVPVVVAIAALTFAVWMLTGHSFHAALGYGICVLVISCPCALGLATPTAVMCGVGKGAKLGILIKSADALETLGKADVVLTDKTGTLTEGEMEVTDVVPAEGKTEAEVLGIAAALESSSEHPIGKAICRRAAADGIAIPSAEDFSAEVGGGIRASVGGVVYKLGSVGFSGGAGGLSAKADELAAAGKTPVVLTDGEAVAGMIAVRDRIKETSRDAVGAFRALGCDVVMLTGDNKITAEAIGGELGIDKDHVISSVRPEEKDRVVSSVMSGERAGDGVRRVAVMIGDGVNDSPSLSRADVGVAVGAGTDVAIESADVVLTKNSLRDGARAILLSRAVMRCVRQNLTWAFFYNVLLIPVAAGALSPFGVTLTPMISAAAMSVSSLTVVTNALRLTRWDPEKAEKKYSVKK